ncbi:MAG: HAD family phosphatase [Lachnospiraceae bacterium]|nr:HAD family phosphatase [Lachnospiraceae bacterium]
MMGVKAVIFDMDGVILDTERVYNGAWDRFAVEYGFDRDMIRRMVLDCTGTKEEYTIRRVTETIGDVISFEDSIAIVRKYFAEDVSENGLPKKAYVDEVLSALKNGGAIVGLASSTKEKIVRREMDEVGLTEYFDVILGGDNVKNGKPAPDIFLTCAELMKCEPKECFVIEDSYNGIRAAHNAGMHAVMVPDQMPPNEEMEALAEVILGDLKQVLSYLESAWN